MHAILVQSYFVDSRCSVSSRRFQFNVDTETYAVTGEGQYQAFVDAVVAAHGLFPLPVTPAPAETLPPQAAAAISSKKQVGKAGDKLGAGFKATQGERCRGRSFPL